jgi:menaquinone-dependent protoporphyrinogen IX oxidase
MPSHVLVAYALREGSTAEIAETIGAVLWEAGAEVDVLPVKEVRNLEGYDAVVLGSAVHIGKVLPEAVQFAKHHQRVLADLPVPPDVAQFTACSTADQGTNERGPLRQQEGPAQPQPGPPVAARPHQCD